jgi:hypothetical protein
VRKRYYEDNGEDALLMVCDKMPPVEDDLTEATPENGANEHSRNVESDVKSQRLINLYARGLLSGSLSETGIEYELMR